MGEQVKAEKYVKPVEFKSRTLEEIERIGWVKSSRKIGTELEVVLINKHTLKPAKAALQVLKKASEKGYAFLTNEICEWVIEINGSAIELGKKALRTLERETEYHLKELKKLCPKGIDIVLHGIWPLSDELFKEEDLDKVLYTHNTDRYKILYNITKKLRGQGVKQIIPSTLGIDQELSVLHDTHTTSFQLHISPETIHMIPDIYNATTLSIPITMYLSANSPFVFGTQYAYESRIFLCEDTSTTALTKQCTFPPHPMLELKDFLKKMVYLNDVMLPIDPKKEYGYLELFTGFVWYWVRPKFYRTKEGIEWGIEIRHMPAGPTTKDMVANASVQIALSYALANKLKEMRKRLGDHVYAKTLSKMFGLARRAFYEVAKKGEHALTCKVAFPSNEKTMAEFLNKEFMFMYEEGAKQAGIDIDKYIDIVQNRIKQGPPAKQQIKRYKELKAEFGEKKALKHVCKEYYKNHKLKP